MADDFEGVTEEVVGDQPQFEHDGVGGHQYHHHQVHHSQGQDVGPLREVLFVGYEHGNHQSVTDGPAQNANGRDDDENQEVAINEVPLDHVCSVFWRLRCVHFFLCGSAGMLNELKYFVAVYIELGPS